VTTITSRKIKSLKPKTAPYFIRDTKIQGFAVKVNPSGTIKYIAEVWHKGRSVRKSVGTYPVMSIDDARDATISYISEVRQGKLKRQKKQYTLREAYENRIAIGGLKPSTVKNYRHVISFYLKDWLDRPVTWITKERVESRFYLIRDKGISGGKPTLSQAVATMRYLSSILNCSMADGLIESNPVDVLKQKRIDRSVKERGRYLPADKVEELLNKTASESHPMTLAVHLMVRTGLRKNEALRLKWSDLETIEGIKCVIIRDTKNHRAHYVPVTEEIRKILKKAENKSEYIFSSTQHPDMYIKDERTTLKRLSKMIGMEFKCHDLRRTFATRAAEVGIDYLMIKRLLNHRSNDITSQYIQWNSRQNLLVMKEALERIQY